ncbi:hypothetical protein EHS25_006531 [Saitozyma podzolica]|uniref:RRM domain-containing protein n=1 Tax=Saitozyma podzolica TaxID=1890683 RepID=A0A427YS45_9TREE|nr:hypothetical protein EHS25_006531 [Saitozyma podzolica]
MSASSPLRDAAHGLHVQPALPGSSYHPVDDAQSIFALPGNLQYQGNLSHNPHGLSLPSVSGANPLHLTGLPGLATPGYAYLDFDDMKRALDVSSLPVNPMTGVSPHIDPASSFSDAPPKKARYSPNLPPQPSTAGPSVPSFNPPQQVFPAMASPLNLGSPSSPLPPQSAASLGPQPSLRTNGPSLTVPSTPIMGMMNGVMGYPMSPFGGFNMNMGSFGNSPIVSPSMNPHMMTGNYGPAAAAAAAAAAGNTTGRTVYVDASVDELLNLVRFGPIENVRLLPEKSCVFISFMDGSTAAGFHADAGVKKLALRGQELRIGWGKASSVPPNVLHAVQQQQATRNVFVGNLPASTTEEDLRDELSKFGPIDQVKIVRDKNIGFVHFLSVGAAMRVVQQLPLEPGWQDRRVNYGKDRCAYVPKAQQAAVQAAQAQAMAAVQSQHSQMPNSPYTPFTPMSPSFNSFSPTGFNSPGFAGATGMASVPGGWVDPNAAGNRTVYVGNLHPDTTTEELCNNIRGGQLQQVKHLREKNIAFVTFVNAANAVSFYHQATSSGLTINTRRLKIGWGKPSGPMSPALLQAVQAGASRNVYLGSISDFDLFTEDKLRTDFAEFGGGLGAMAGAARADGVDIEMINFLKEKGAAFVNFASIQSAQKAIDGIKLKPEYATLRIAYGKDRCANAPRGNNAGTHIATPMGSRPNNNRQTSHTSHTSQQPVEDDVAMAPAPAAVELDAEGPYDLDGTYDEELVDVPASFE